MSEHEEIVALGVLVVGSSSTRLGKLWLPWAFTSDARLQHGVGPQRHGVPAMTAGKAFSEDCEAIANALDARRLSQADDAFRRLITSHSAETLRADEPLLRQLLDRFYHKRKRDLSEALNRVLTERERTPPPSPVPPQRASGLSPARQLTGVITATTRLPVEEDSFRGAVREEYRSLSLHHIFQWATFYRDFLGRVFEHLFRLTEEPHHASLVSIAAEETARHATEIFGKGYQYVSQRSGADALAKSLNGLQGFLGLPVEFYSTLAFNVSDAADSRRLRNTCSAILAGITQGYGAVDFGGQRGWQILPRFPRTWAHTLAFLTPDAAEGIVSRLEEGELRNGLETTVLPVLGAVDGLLAAQSETDFCLPRLGQFVWDARRLEISLSLPRVVERRRYLELHCYLVPSFVQRGNLEESANRGANLIAAPLRPDIREWTEAHDILRTTLLDTQAQDVATVVQRGLDVLNHELAKYLGSARRAEPITFNLARTFPLQNPFLTRYFLVYRASVRNLLKVFERETGVRLWCSVRRSGKTTACFDLGASSGNAIVVNQTMEHTEQYAEANLFSEAFVSALAAGSQLPPSFFRDAVKACVRDRDAEGAKLVFVLDEYETLFERLRLAVGRDRELRYSVAQPLLNQMVGFSRDNLLIFIGQRPDSHYILMDQNQLSPYVRQDPFPLFEHTKGRTATEFTELLRKVLTERVGFDLGFADAVFGETSGHPYLTVNVMVDFFQWMIDEKRRAGQLHLHAEDFRKFARARLIPERLRTSAEYDFFKNAIREALSEQTQRENPWLFVVYRTLQEIARESPEGLECSRARYDELVEPLVQPLGWEPADLLNGAAMANFLRTNKTVRPAIPLLARIAVVCRPRHVN